MRFHFAIDIESDDSSGSGDGLARPVNSTVMGRGLIPQATARPTQAATVLERDDNTGSGAECEGQPNGPSPHHRYFKASLVWHQSAIWHPYHRLDGFDPHGDRT